MRLAITSVLIEIALSQHHQIWTNFGPRIPKVSIVLEDALILGFSPILPDSGGKIVGSRASDGLVGTAGYRNHQKRSLDNVSEL